jgi:hypothetical protein
LKFSFTTIDVAESAVLEAISARMKADELVRS